MFSFIAMTSPPPVACPGKDMAASTRELQLPAGDLAREVLHAAVGADHEALRVDVAECGADAFGYELGRLDVHVAEIEDAEDHALRGQLLEDRRGRAAAGRPRSRSRPRGTSRARRGTGSRRSASRGRSRRSRSTCAAPSSRHALERARDRLERVLARVVGARLEVRLVDLDDVRAGGDEVAQLLVHRLRVGERERAQVRVVVVLRLLAHRERAGDGDADRPRRERPQELGVAHLHLARAPDRPDDARHRDSDARSGRAPSPARRGRAPRARWRSSSSSSRAGSRRP